MQMTSPLNISKDFRFHKIFQVTPACQSRLVSRGLQIFWLSDRLINSYMHDNGALRKCAPSCLSYITDLFIIYTDRSKYCSNNIDGRSHFKAILISLKKGSLYKPIGKYCNFKAKIYDIWNFTLTNQGFVLKTYLFKVICNLLTTKPPQTY